MADDMSDEGDWQSRAANKLYSSAFAQARDDLVSLDFDLNRLEAILTTQSELEATGECDFAAAAGPTSDAYGLVAREVAQRCDSVFTPDQAQQLGQSLGKAVYLVDAIRDYEQDFGNAYNPLCQASGPEDHTLPPQLYQEVLTYIGRELATGRHRAATAREQLASSWHAVERVLFGVAGIRDRKSVVLYSGCISRGEASTNNIYCEELCF